MKYEMFAKNCLFLSVNQEFWKQIATTPLIFLKISYRLTIQNSDKRISFEI